MAELDFNVAIAENVMGWIVDRETRCYCEPDRPEVWAWLPDFRFVDADYQMFLQKMKSLGYLLTLGPNPSEESEGTKPYFAACFSGYGQRFPVSAHDARRAVLISALLARPVAAP